MPQNLRYKGVEGVGIEFECTLLSEKPLSAMAANWFPGLLKLDHDASSETSTTQVTDRLTVFNATNIELPGRLEMAGSELVSLPLYPYEVDSFVIKLTSLLSGMGELPMSQRSAIHIHCGFPTSLLLMKKCLLFAMKFESLFFQLAGNGYRFRGLDNNSIYCKPLTSPWGPPIVRGTDDNNHQLFRVEEVLAAKTTDEFWRIFGVNPDDPKRYHPSRYFWLNILSTLIHGTLEFRIWNVTLNPRYLKAEIELCRKVADLLMVIPINYLENLPNASVYEMQDNGRLLSKLLLLIKSFSEPVSEFATNTLLGLLERNHPVVLPQVFVQTHLWTKYVADSTHCRSERLPDSIIIPSGFIDSHQAESTKLDLLSLLLRSENV